MTACISDDLLAAFVAGEASADELTSIEHHLAECAECAQICRAVSLADAPRSPTLLDPTTVRFARELPRGTSIGRYLLLDVVGTGGMSVVYSAYDPQLDRRVALKFLAASIDPARMSREARAIARLAHPNVVNIHDVGELDGAPFVAMELIVGATLDHFLATTRPWPEVLAVLLQAGDGLAAAHAAGVVHRDIKPSNILVGDDRRVRVSDFGLARLSEREEPAHESSTSSDEHATQVGARIGTPAYMAPEQRLDGDVDARADQYSFALVAYEALFGERPPAATRGDDVPVAVREALLRATAEDRELRFAALPELLDVLRAHDPTDPRNVGNAALAAAGAMTQRSRRLIWIALTVAFALIAAAAVVTTLVARSQRDRARETEQLARRAERLAEQRLDDELRLNVRLAFERGDWIASLGNVAQLLSRGVDEPMLRMVAGATSWAWPTERLRLRGVHSILPGGERTYVQYENEVVVIDHGGTVLVRVPMVAGSARGMTIDDAGTHLLVVDPDLRWIPIDAPDTARVIARATDAAPIIAPQFVGDGLLAAMVGEEIIVYDTTGTVVRRTPRMQVTPLRHSARLGFTGGAETSLLDIRSGVTQTLPFPIDSMVERADHTLAAISRGDVRIVDRAGRTLRSIDLAGDASDVRFSRDGTHLAVTVDDDRLIFDVASGERRARITSTAAAPVAFDETGLYDAVGGVVRWWSLDGVLRQQFVAPARNVTRVWRTGDQLAVLAGDVLQMYAKPFVSPPAMPGGCTATRMIKPTDDGALIYCDDKHVYRWSGPALTKLTAKPVDHPEWVFSDALGDTLLALRTDGIELLARGTQQFIPLSLWDALGMVITTGAVYVVVDKGRVRRLDLDTLTWAPEVDRPVGTTLRWTEVGTPVGTTPDDMVSELTPLPGDRRAIAIVGRTTIVEIGPEGLGAVRPLPSPAESLAASGDGTTLALRNPDGTIMVLDRATLAPRHTTPAAATSITGSFALDRTGARLIAVTTDRRIAIIDTHSGAALFTYDVGHVELGGVGFTSDGANIVANIAGTPTRIALPYDARPAAELARELACRFTPAATRPSSCR